jgi:hypothetical protein
MSEDKFVRDFKKAADFVKRVLHSFDKKEGGYLLSAINGKRVWTSANCNIDALVMIVLNIYRHEPKVRELVENFLNLKGKINEERRG